MFGTNEKFNLVRAAYTRRASTLYIFEDYYKHGQLRLGSNKAGEMLNITSFLFDIKLTVNGAPVSYTYFADEGCVRLTSGDAVAELAFTDRAHMRIRGENAGLQLKLRPAEGGKLGVCRGLYALPGGNGWEADFNNHGRMFFKSISGSFIANSHFCDEKNSYDSVTFDFLPDSATGTFEAAVHLYDNCVVPFGEYEDFDDLVAANRADFAEFTKKYPPAAKGLEEAAKYAMWVVWSHRTGITDALPEPIILFHNAWVVVAASWQQSYNAMPMLCDPEEAWRLICTMFAFQDERTGRLPGMLTYKGGNAGMQPPFQGFALDFLIRNVGDGFLTKSECLRMYPKFAKWANYWTTYRNAGRGDDVTHVLSTHESGWDDASIFKDGFPAIDPNGITFIILLMEATARLARGCGKNEEADKWQKRAEKLTKTLIKEFWDGERFVTKVKGKPVSSLSLACYQPIILGKRLPQEIIDKIAEKLTEEGGWLTEIGLASESMKSELVTFGISFVCGRVVAPQNMILTVGLQAAGKQKEAEMIARRFCEHVSREGIVLGFAPYDYYPLSGKEADEQIPPQPADGWPWSSWCANNFLTMACGVIGK